MLKKSAYFLIPLAISACSATPVKKEAQFWQRANMSEAIYAQGPKAQQMLHRDISRCVVELRELERLGVLKNAIPVDVRGYTLDPDQVALYDWDTPERDKHLFAEHSDYTDFESCMGSKGWERIEHVPFDVGNKGRENYLRANVNYQDDDDWLAVKRTKSPTSNEAGDYGDLNN